MKSRFLILLLALCAPMFILAQAVTVPQNVLDKFKADYPDAVDVKWEKGKKDFSAEFTFAGDEMEVVYDKDAQVVEVEQKIDLRSVPDAVMDAFEARFGSVEAEEISRIGRGGIEYFELEYMENGVEKEVLFDGDGNIMPSDGEEEEGDDKD